MLTNKLDIFKKKKKKIKKKKKKIIYFKFVIVVFNFLPFIQSLWNLKQFLLTAL